MCGEDRLCRICGDAQRSKHSTHVSSGAHAWDDAEGKQKPITKASISDFSGVDCGHRVRIERTATYISNGLRGGGSF